LINTRKLLNAPEPLSTTPEDRGVGQFVKLVEFMCASNTEGVRYDSMTSLMQQAFILRFQKRISHHQSIITLNLWALGHIFLKQVKCQLWRRGGGLGSRPKKMYGERLGDGVEYHLMKPTPRR